MLNARYVAYVIFSLLMMTNILKADGITYIPDEQVSVANDAVEMVDNPWYPPQPVEQVEEEQQKKLKTIDLETPDERFKLDQSKPSKSEEEAVLRYLFVGVLVSLLVCLLVSFVFKLKDKTDVK